MKLYRITYQKGVEGMSSTAIKKYPANSKYEAEKNFKNDFGDKLNSNGIDKVTMLNVDESELPTLTDMEIARAGQMFINSENPVLEYQLMKTGI